MVKEFRDFILRGNVIDLAVGIVIGAAFGAIISSFVADILTPLLGLIGVPDFQAATLSIGDATLRYGLFLNALITFLLVAAAIFFIVVRPMNRMAAKNADPEAPSAKECPECLSAIPMAAKRCAFCASVQP